MDRRLPERIVAFALATAMAVSPALSPLTVYADEITGEGNATETIGQTDPSQGTDSNMQVDTPAGTVPTETTGNEGTSGEETTNANDSLESTDPEQLANENAENAEDNENANGTAEEKSSESEQEAGATGTMSAQSTEQANEEQTATPKIKAETLVAGSWSESKDIDTSKAVTLGTIGKGMQAIRMSVASTNLAGGISYRGCAGGKWLAWASNGTQLGSTNSTLEALRIKLTGEIANTYSLSYRVYVSGRGWMGWTRDGDQAGTSGLNKQVEAIELKLVEKGVGLSAETEETGNQDAFDSVGLKATAHVQRIGWTKQTSGKIITVGTTGRSLRMEALRIGIDAGDLTGNINYQTHVQRIGWQNPVKNYALAGTQGRSFRVEALKVWLDGELADNFDVWYRLHVQTIGWMGWGKNGTEASGTAGFSRRVEAIQIALTPKDAEAPSVSPASALGATFIDGNSALPMYNSIVSGKAQDYVGENKVSGTTGKGIPITGMSTKLKLIDGFSGYISCRVHQSKVGWGNWAYNGATAGDGKNAVECIKIRLGGVASKLFDVYYRVHVSQYGWLDWAKNGESAGSTGCSLSVQAYQVVIVPKINKAPGSTANPMVDKVKHTMYAKAQKLNSSTNYVICVDDGNQHTGIFKGSKGNRKLIHYSLCGTPGGNAVAGTFRVTGKQYTTGGGGYCEYYITEGLGSGSFHSILCVPGTFTPLYAVSHQLRKHETHGCIRLPLDVAGYIYNKVPSGSTIHVYNVH